MSENLKVLQVFIASPNDLVDERRAIKEVADSLNTAFGREVGLQIQLLGWEERLPGYGRAQGQINADVDRADLFVGFLWRRWGSDPGNPKYTSGFEEEFNRALERREKSGAPEISLFFKAVDSQSLADPGDQFKKVLDFREAVVQSKKVLFRNFTDIADWKEQTRELLERHLLRLVASTIAVRGQAQPQAPPPASTEDSGKDATGQKSESSTSAAKQQVVRIWSDALEAIKLDELSEFSKSRSLDKLKIARLGLVAAGMTNRDIEAEMPGVHLTNVLFKSRKQIELTRLEWLLVLRANLIPQVGYQPGWFWLRRTILDVKGALVYLACHDEHASVRKAAIGYAAGLGLLLRGGSGGKPRPIDVLCSHNDENTRKSSLEYLAEKGSAKDLPLVEKLRKDSDSDVRSQADTARNAILLRDDASQFFESSVLTSPWMSDDSLGAIQKHVAEIKTELLRKALAHPDTKVQVFAAKELVARSLMPFEEIKALKDSEGICEVFRVYFLKEIGAGQKFQPKEIREALEPTGLGIGLFSHTRGDGDHVVAELFKLYTYEELLAVASSESKDSPIAYRILAEKHFDKFGEKIRAELRNEFALLRAKLKTPETPHTLGSISWSLLAAMRGEWQPDISDFAAIALSALAINGTCSDRELIIRFLDHKSERVRIAAIIALRRVGRPQDKDLVLQIAEAADKEVAVEAAKTALALVPGETGSASRLLKSRKPQLVKQAILSLLSCDPKNVWPQVEDRLYDEDEEIRKLICAYAIKAFPAQRLVKLLDTYSAKERYFYNVVYFLDRVVYAKLPLRKLFIKEIEAVLD